MFLHRAFVVWLVIIGAEMIHGIPRTLLLVPLVGDFRARQIGVFSGSALILGIATLFVRWIRPVKRSELWLVGVFWVVLTVVFEISFGGLVAGFCWERIIADFDLQHGGLMPLGLLFMALSPTLAARIRS